MNLWLRSALKEAVAIGPIWLAACLGVAAAPLWSTFLLDPLVLMAYIFGAVAIGAQVIGHEYAHRTMASLITQPVRRTTILAIKMAVLAVALLTLTAVASVGPYAPLTRFPMQATLDSRIVYLPTLMGLTLAPYLALVARGTLGGAVFSIAVPGVLLIASDLMGVLIYGTGRPGDIDRLKYEVFPIGTVVACAFCAIALWRRFERVEVLGDSGGHVSLPSRDLAGTEGLRRAEHNRIWLLMAKELRLQQMTFIVAGFYVIGFTSLWWFNRAETALPVPWQPLMALYGVLVSMLVGALASAEERQLGTVDWQGLLPISRRTQFAVKLLMVLGISIACAVLLPAAVAISLVTPNPTPARDGFLVWMCIITMACALGALYVSSLTSSGVKAVAIAMPFVAGCFILLRFTDMFLGYAVRHGWIDRSFLLVPRLSHSQSQIVAAAVVGWIALVALTFAYRNHWTAGKSARVAIAQTATIAAAIVVAGVAMTLVGFR